MNVKTISITECPVCTLRRSEPLAQCRDYVYGVLGVWNYVRCLNEQCRHAWLHNRPIESEIPAIYQNYYTVNEAQGSDSKSSLSLKARAFLWPTPFSARADRRRATNPLLDCLAPPATVLEVGSGSGVEAARLRARGYAVTAQDIDSLLSGTGAFIGPLSALLPTRPFEAIYSSHAIEHVGNLHLEMAEWRRLLVGKPALVVRTPNVDAFARVFFRHRWRGFEPPRHFHLFSRTSLALLLSTAGFESVSITTCSAGGGRSFATSALQSERDRPIRRAAATIAGQLAEDALSVSAPKRNWELVAIAAGSLSGDEFARPS
jgi:SAM-dependent methyltransferase